MSTTAENNKQDITPPLPKFRFEVDFGPELKDAAFLEVAGLETNTHVVEFRKSNKSDFSTDKIPGATRFSNVTLKRGVLPIIALFGPALTKASWILLNPLSQS